VVKTGRERQKENFLSEVDSRWFFEKLTFFLLSHRVASSLSCTQSEVLVPRRVFNDGRARNHRKAFGLTTLTSIFKNKEEREKLSIVV